MQPRTIALMLLAVGLGACGEAGRWIEVPPLILTCDDLKERSFREELESSDKFSLARGMAQGICNQTGAGNFAGRTRCENDKAQLLCQP